MAKELSKSRRVYYINAPYTYKDLYSEVAKDIPEPILKAQRRGKPYAYQLEDYPNIWSYTPAPVPPINWLPKGSMFAQMLKRNAVKVHAALDQVYKDHQVKGRPVFINCYDPFYLPKLPNTYDPLINMYMCIDDIEHSDYIGKHGRPLELTAISESDVTLVTSTILHKNNVAYNPNTIIFHNAADGKVFKTIHTQQYDRPKELEGTDPNSKVIGYIGNLDDGRVDFELLKQVATDHPDKILLLVGPINSTNYKAVGLDQMPNVRFAGSQKLIDLPQYLQHFDVAIIPFLCNTLTYSIYPLKVNEYLTGGKPVIATRFSPDIQSFGEMIYLADNASHFSQIVSEAVHEHSEEAVAKRLAMAEQNTWTARIEQLWDIVDQYAPKGVTV